MTKGFTDEIMLKYIEDKLKGKLINDFDTDFINEAIKFNINDNICTICEFMRIDYVIKKMNCHEIMDYIKLYSVYGYILYQCTETEELDSDQIVVVLQLVLEISDAITSYLTMRYNENELKGALKQIQSKLNFNNELENKF
ncbi:hypothetical protein [Clostridium sp.]|uniref:hypothetical protein n=1 Tax=Clostridium sp. TaxID=1506 RepID=UPI003217A99F